MIAAFDVKPRRWAAFLAVAAAWILLIWLWQTSGVAIWFVILVSMMTVALGWDLRRATPARIEVWPGRIVWSSALTNGDRGDIDTVHLSRRFDGALRITLLHPDGAHTRLPPDIVAPLDALETALAQAGISAERHPFKLF